VARKYPLQTTTLKRIIVIVVIGKREIKER